MRRALLAAGAVLLAYLGWRRRRATLARVPTTAGLPDALHPGEWPVLLEGPFVVERDGFPLGIGGELTVADGYALGSVEVRWSDGDRWHFLPDDFPTAMRVSGQTVVAASPTGQIRLRPLTIHDQELIHPNPHAASVEELVARVRAELGLSRLRQDRTAPL